MLLYILPALLLGGFYFIFYRNSPRHANLFLLMIVACVAISFIPPRSVFLLISAGLGIAGLFVLAVQSRNVRAKAVAAWIADKGFQITSVPFAQSLFHSGTTGTVSYHSYKGTLPVEGAGVPVLLAVRYNTYRSGNTTAVVFHCTYYFNEGVNIEQLEQKLTAAKEATAHSSLWKSQLRYFDLKAVEIFRPAAGGLAVSWRVPDTAEGYNDRYQWLIEALKK